MTIYKAPGVYVEDVLSGARPIEAVGTSVAAILGNAPKADHRTGEPIAINSYLEFRREFLPQEADGAKPVSNILANAVSGFFSNGGRRCYVVNLGKGAASITDKHLEPLDVHDDISLLVAPGFSDVASHNVMISACENRGDRMAILDTARKIDPLAQFAKSALGEGAQKGLHPPEAERGHACVFTPWIKVSDVLTGDANVEQPPSGHLAGLFGLTDARRGVHKAPANMVLQGATGLTRSISEAEQGQLNPLGINCIRMFHDGIKVWGSRTLAKAESDMRYIPVRRLVIMVSQSVKRGTRWVVFEPNDETLWKSIRRDVGAFLNTLWRSGALMGATANEAYFVKCDSETTTQADIDAGRVIAHIGLATVKPAEFVILRLGQSVEQQKVEEEA